MSGINTNKEHLRYNEKEWKLRILYLIHAKISLTHATYTKNSTQAIFVWPTPSPRHPRQNLTHVTHEPTLSRTHAIHVTHAI